MDKLVDAIAEMREGDALMLTRQMLDSGADPLAILNDCRTAMALVGKRFETGEYFLPELILAGEMLKQISAEVKPRIHSTVMGAGKKRGKVVIGTVKGDIHDIGKDIVVFMLEANDFEVYDLGVDVPPHKFVDTVLAVKPAVVGLSGLLTLAFDSMKETVTALQAAGLRDSVKIMVGGGATDERVRDYAGADAFGADAMAAVTLAQQWIGKK